MFIPILQDQILQQAWQCIILVFFHVHWKQPLRGLLFKKQPLHIFYAIKYVFRAYWFLSYTVSKIISNFCVCLCLAVSSILQLMKIVTTPVPPTLKSYLLRRKSHNIPSHVENCHLCPAPEPSRANPLPSSACAFCPLVPDTPASSPFKMKPSALRVAV